MTLYRYEDQFEEDGSCEVLSLREYQVIKETPCGYWVSKYSYYKKNRWVSKTSNMSWWISPFSNFLVSTL